VEFEKRRDCDSSGSNEAVECKASEHFIGCSARDLDGTATCHFGDSKLYSHVVENSGAVDKDEQYKYVLNFQPFSIYARYVAGEYNKLSKRKMFGSSTLPG